MPPKLEEVVNRLDERTGLQLEKVPNDESTWEVWKYDVTGDMETKLMFLRKAEGMEEAVADNNALELAEVVNEARTQQLFQLPIAKKHDADATARLRIDHGTSGAEADRRSPKNASYRSCSGCSRAGRAASGPVLQRRCAR